nr:hypothetical protein [Gemmatimonadota bacterium]NIU76115.1 hypothetical protein [Gammaproteobacteria bacterium]
MPGGGAVKLFQDEWLKPTVEELIGADKLEELREDGAEDTSLWEAVVERELLTDEQLLNALSTRFRLKLADVSQ